MSARYTAPRDELGFVVGQLQLRATSTSDSALKLISELKLWDAEILIRTVLESTVRLAFICLDAHEAESRASEFLNTLPDIAHLKRHRRIEDSLERVEDPELDRWRPLQDMLLDQEQLDDLRTRLPRAERNRVVGRWGVAQIAGTFGRHDSAFRDLAAISHSYGMSSHAAHQDGDAILTMSERELRSEERISSIELAHGAREIGDLLTFQMIRALAAYRLYGLETDAVLGVHSECEPLLEEMKEAHAAWQAIEYQSSHNSG